MCTTYLTRGRNRKNSANNPLESLFNQYIPAGRSTSFSLENTAFLNLSLFSRILQNQINNMFKQRLLKARYQYLIKAKVLFQLTIQHNHTIKNKTLFKDVTTTIPKLVLPIVLVCYFFLQLYLSVDTIRSPIIKSQCIVTNIVLISLLLLNLKTRYKQIAPIIKTLHHRSLSITLNRIMDRLEELPSNQFTYHPTYKPMLKDLTHIGMK